MLLMHFQQKRTLNSLCNSTTVNSVKQEGQFLANSWKHKNGNFLLKNVFVWGTETASSVWRMQGKDDKQLRTTGYAADPVYLKNWYLNVKA